MEETHGFETHNLKVLVLDEADEMLAMGFRETLNAILEYLPKERQTMLFSATLSKQVQELGRLSLRDSEHIFLHDKNADKSDLANLYETPVKLTQYYMEIPIQEKLNTLYSFLRMHSKQKIIVFFATCKQVRFAHETFRQLKTGLPHMELHGRQKHQKRMAIFFTFKEKKYACLFTTNLAARGLDFPQVDWVVSFDCPEDEETYFHRVGRTARYKSEGKSLLFVTPQEAPFVEKLRAKNQHVHKIQQNPTKRLTITSSLQAYCTQSVELKYLAQKAFICYMKSVYNSSDKKIFDVHKIPVNEFAESLGLIQTPIIRFRKALEAPSASEGSDDDDGDDQINRGKVSKLQKLKDKIKQKKLEKQLAFREAVDAAPEKEPAADAKPKKPDNVKHLKLIGRTNTDIIGDQYEKIRHRKAADDEDDDFLTLKRKHVEVDAQQDAHQQTVLSKNQLKKIKLDGHFAGKNKIFYDEEGNTSVGAQRRAQGGGGAQGG